MGGGGWGEGIILDATFFSFHLCNSFFLLCLCPTVNPTPTMPLLAYRVGYSDFHNLMEFHQQEDAKSYSKQCLLKNLSNWLEPLLANLQQFQNQRKILRCFDNLIQIL